MFYHEPHSPSVTHSYKHLFWIPKHLVLHAHTHTDTSGATRVQYLARGYSDMRTAVAGEQATDLLIVDDPLYLLSLHCPQARSAWYSQMSKY